MVFPHSSSGYRDERARGQAKAFETPSPPSSGFVAPPGVYAPPAVGTLPPPPPPVFAPVAAGGAAAVFPIAGLAAIAGGIGLGLWVKKDIDKWKKNAADPWYDTDYTYGKGEGWKTNPQWDASKEVGFDQRADDLYKDHLFDLLQNYQNTDLYSVEQVDGQTWYFRSGFGWRPFIRTDGQEYKNHVHARFTDFYGYNNRAALTVNGYDYAGWSQAWNYPATGENSVQVTPDGVPLICPGGITTGICTLPMPPNSNTYIERWADPGSKVDSGVFDTYEVTTGNAWRRRFVQTVVVLDDAAAADEYVLGHGQTWQNAVASPGSQPSLEEQLAGQKLPGGKARRGYYIAPPINYPFTLVEIGPGSPPVTVPDVVIDPGTGTEPGTVTIIPPSPPEFPSPEAGEFERKPRNPMPGFINVATESQDFLEAMHQGLPKHLRSKGRWGVIPDGDIILGDIIRNWDQWDAQVALEAFVNNQIEDHILGKYYFGRLPPRMRAGQLQKPLLKKAVTYLPQVHFANGQHHISIGEVEIELVPAR